ncbi:hypothetical protein CALVIDRAFT_567741 [Calocera viscosa TUFC12733]|uniref:Aminoglycoside phosphotransferase domain-containing protein n=1 Tax=Calocera viscosa (strain TUFC12733) TaxID=1330018 RepID=A0A167HUN3_CALVF|nr:hypothetical protein CALVIDRAFT_567741 [Calocera viscosa TUFC12733]
MATPLYRGSPVNIDELDFPATSLRHDSAVEPRIAVVAKSLFASECNINHFANGSRNEVYLVKLAQPRPPLIPPTILCRISKAASSPSIQTEVDTMLYVSERSRIPVPRVFAYCTNGNVLSQAYLFIEHITTGKRMREAFETLDEEGKARATREYAGVVYKLSQLRCTHIGSLRRYPEGTYYLGGPSLARSKRAVSADQRIHATLERPFSAVVPWLLAMEEDQLHFVREHPELINERFNAYGSKSATEVMNDASLVLRRLIGAIPDACDTGALSKVLCLWHYDLNGGSIFISTRAPDAGRIVSVIDWDGAIVTPIWRVVRWPDFISVRGVRDCLPEADKKRFQNILRNEIMRLDSDGFLRKAFQERYELSRELVEVVTQPWNCMHERQQWLDAWEKKREACKAVKPESSGWMSDKLVRIFRRGRRHTRR